VEPGDSGVALGCVLRLCPEQPLNSDDVQVSRVEQLDCSLTMAVNEELLSNVIGINVVAARVTQVRFTANSTGCYCH